MPTKKIQKSDIIGAALEILKTEDFTAVTARRLAEMLDCSVQPIYLNFTSMDELERGALEAIKTLYYEYMQTGAREPQAYRGMGLAYIRFARDYPNYFKLLFMGKTDLSADAIIEADDSNDGIIEHGMQMTGFDSATQKAFHLKAWIFTHGLATMVATGTVQFDQAEIDRLLTETVAEMAAGAKQNRSKKSRYFTKPTHAN